VRHLVLVAPRYLPHLGGVEIHVSELASRVAATGWRVTVATIDDDPAAARDETVEGVRVLRFRGHLPVLGQDTVSRGLRDFLRSGADDADVLHVQNYHARVAVASLWTSAPRLVFTPHYLGVGEGAAKRAQHAAYRAWAKRVLRVMQPTVVHVSQTEADEFARDLGAGLVRETHVIPNGLRLDDLLQAEPVAADGSLLLVASRLEAYKRPGLAIEALPHLPDDIRVAIAGDGPELEHLRAQAARLGVGDRVQVLGRLSWQELCRWYRAADVFLSFSTRECYGMSVTEALAAGAGVAASDIPAHREVFERAGHPIDTLVPIGAGVDEVVAAVERARKYRADPGVRTIATWDDMATQLLEVYGARR
jgi:glycosyltransferase involved in cell wall biosynthesis